MLSEYEQNLSKVVSDIIIIVIDQKLQESQNIIIIAMNKKPSKRT